LQDEIDCLTESNNTSPNESEMPHALKDASIQNEIVNLQPQCHHITSTLLCNPICTQNYGAKQFSILAKGHSPFHLTDLEAIFIKTSNPILCRQKEVVYYLTWLSH